MTCHGCGECCRTMIVPAELYNVQILSLRENFEKIVYCEGKEFIVLKSVCKFLTPDRKCRIYRNRPIACKMFPIEEVKPLWKEIYPDCGLL